MAEGGGHEGLLALDHAGNGRLRTPNPSLVMERRGSCFRFGDIYILAQWAGDPAGFGVEVKHRGFEVAIYG